MSRSGPMKGARTGNVLREPLFNGCPFHSGSPAFSSISSRRGRLSAAERPSLSPDDRKRTYRFIAFSDIFGDFMQRPLLCQ